MKDLELTVLEIYAWDLERMSYKEQEQRSFPSKNITWTPNEHGMISFCEQASNEKHFQWVSTYIQKSMQLLVSTPSKQLDYELEISIAW